MTFLCLTPLRSQSPEEFAEMYRKNSLTGGHVIKLGPGNDEAARKALAAWPNGLQVGGGIQVSNAQEWIDAGAEKVSRLRQCEMATGLMTMSWLPYSRSSSRRRYSQTKNSRSNDFKQSLKALARRD